MTCSIKRFATLTCAFLLSSLGYGQFAQAGGCFFTTPTGSTLAAACPRWDQTQTVTWNFDAGPLKGPPNEADPSGGAGGGSGCQLAKNLDISNADGVAMVERAFKRWTDTPRSNLTTAKGTALLNGEDVNFSNIEKVWVGGFIWPVPADSDKDASSVSNPMVFDHSGLITQAVNGQCQHCSIFGFATPNYATNNDPPQNTINSLTITRAQAVINAACVEPRVIDPVCGDCCPPDVTADTVEGSTTHEIGHFLGLDHTGINLKAFVDCEDGECNAADMETIPTMIGFFVPKMNYNTLHADDIKTFETIYPDATFAAQTCTVKGYARRNSPFKKSNSALPANDIDAQRGVEVVARLIGDPMNTAVGTVAGSYVKRFTQGAQGQSGTDGKTEANCNETDGGGGPTNADECAAYEIHGLEPGSYFLTVHDFGDPTDESVNLGFVIEPLAPTLSTAGILPDQLDPNLPNANSPDNQFTCVAGATIVKNPRAN